MNKLKGLQILLLKERLEKLTGKKVCLRENVSPGEILNIINTQAKTKQGITKVKNNDFELVFDIEGDTLNLTWINVKSKNVIGPDLLKALSELAKEKGAHKIRATGVRGIYYGKTAYGYYVLLKWGFIPEGGIKFLNDILDTHYSSIQEAFKDPEFWPKWRENGTEYTGTYNIFNPLKEEISAKEAYNNLGSIQTIIGGKRNVGWVTFPKKQELYLVRGSGLEILPVPLNPNSYIIYKQGFEKEAIELLNIANKYQGRLSVNATEEDSRRIGQLLGYKQSDIDAYIIHNKQFRS